MSLPVDAAGTFDIRYTHMYVEEPRLLRYENASKCVSGEERGEKEIREEGRLVLCCALFAGESLLASTLRASNGRTDGATLYILSLIHI